MLVLEDEGLTSLVVVRVKLDGGSGWELECLKTRSEAVVSLWDRGGGILDSCGETNAFLASVERRPKLLFRLIGVHDEELNHWVQNWSDRA